MAGGGSVRRGGWMLDPAVRCVVGIDVAKHNHVVCAMGTLTGEVRQKAPQRSCGNGRASGTSSLGMAGIWLS
jgi:hypothetical protein